MTHSRQIKYAVGMDDKTELILIHSKVRIDRANLSGITEEGYKTTLISCTCEDFQSRSLPCGHIYRLARELKILQTPNIKRSLELLATFKNGFAEGWALGLESFTETI